VASVRRARATHGAPDLGAVAQRASRHPIGKPTVRRYVQRRKQELGLRGKEIFVPQKPQLGRGKACRLPVATLQAASLCEHYLDVLEKKAGAMAGSTRGSEITGSRGSRRSVRLGVMRTSRALRLSSRLLFLNTTSGVGRANQVPALFVRIMP
jgi:hypothetical protein